jgi:hypothetical protein
MFFQIFFCTFLRTDSQCINCRTYTQRSGSGSFSYTLLIQVTLMHQYTFVKKLRFLLIFLNYTNFLYVTEKHRNTSTRGEKRF